MYEIQMKQSCKNLVCFHLCAVYLQHSFKNEERITVQHPIHYP